MATAAKTAVWVWRPTPGPFRKTKGTSAALAQPLHQLQRLPQSGGEIETKVCGAVSVLLMAEPDVQEIVGLAPLELLTTKESDTRSRPQAGAVCVCGRKPARTKFHFTQAVCRIREQYSLERAQGKGDGF